MEARATRTTRRRESTGESERARANAGCVYAESGRPYDSMQALSLVECVHGSMQVSGAARNTGHSFGFHLCRRARCVRICVCTIGSDTADPPRNRRSPLDADDRAALRGRTLHFVLLSEYLKPYMIRREVRVRPAILHVYGDDTGWFHADGSFSLDFHCQ